MVEALALAMNRSRQPNQPMHALSQIGPQAKQML